MPALVGIHVLKAVQIQRRGWPEHRRAKARRPFGRLCPAMTNEGRASHFLVLLVHCLSIVMPALVAGIHVLTVVQIQRRGWPEQV
ncbi:MAG: hypothetical protein WAL11_09085, partial [Pseudolabrys sp.]